MSKEIEQLVKERNELQFKAEDISEVKAKECWTRLGVATRHIERLVSGELTLTPAVVEEVENCFQRVRLWLESKG